MTDVAHYKDILLTRKRELYGRLHKIEKDLDTLKSGDSGERVAHRVQAGGGNVCARLTAFVAGGERNAVEPLIVNLNCAKIAGFRKAKTYRTRHGGEKP